tara:strand:+ start:2397 stop:3365 length:969 start_codon:yes stop_codon:yes gene_type:complete
MKHPFKLSKSNIIYAAIVAVIVIILNLRIYGFDAYAIGMSFGSIFGIVLIATLLAFLFWFMLGRKEKGGTTTFNIVLTLMLLGSLSEFGQIAQDRKKPIDDLQRAISDYKENTLANPDSTDANYAALSQNVNNSIEAMIKNSHGEERKIYVALKGFLVKSDSVNMEWNRAHGAFIQPRILDFTLMNNTTEYEFQKEVIQDYINQSNTYKAFVENRVDNFKEQTRHIDRSSQAYKGFMKGLTKKDSIQKPIFMPYILAHIEYGEDTKRIVEILEKEDGKWRYEDDAIVFENYSSQVTYEALLDNAIRNEDIINELVDKLVEVM